MDKQKIKGTQAMAASAVAQSGARESIRKKMLIRTVTPTVAGLVIAGILIILIAGSEIQNLQNENIMDISQNASYQISGYFTKYMEISRQLGANRDLLNLFDEVEPGVKVTEAPGFAAVMETMENMRLTDADSIVDVWAADVDSSQFFEDTGFVSEIGEWDITTRSWYNEVVAAGTTIVSEPYVTASSSEMVSSIVTPIYDENGKMEGVAGVDLSLGALAGMMQEQKLGESGFLLLMTQAGMIMYAEDAFLVHTYIADAQIDESVKQGFSSGSYGTYRYRFGGEENYGYMTQAGDSRWVVLSGMPGLEYNMDTYRVILSTVVLFVLMIVIMCIMISRIATGIVKPIQKLHAVADQIARGELDVELDVDSADEIGEVAKSIDKTVVRLKEYITYIDEVADVLNEIAQGNLVFTLKQAYTGEFGKIKSALENISFTMTSTIEGITSSAEQVTSGAGQIAQAAQSLADGATSQAAAVEELLATVTDISQQVKENAEYARNAAEGAGDVRTKIELSNQEMKQVINAMEEINHCSNAINAIISSIEEIADQTDLLSLNASIEAARAGDMGRGFAVVANEVGNLARESVQAVQRSTELIENSREAVERGMKLVNGTAARLSESVAGVVGLAEQMSGLSEAAEGQTKSLAEVVNGINQIASVVSDNSAMSEESAASSEELSAEATALNEMVGIFHIG